MHANTIYKETKTIAVLAVAILMVAAAAAVVLSSESTDAATSYKVNVEYVAQSGSTQTSTFPVAEDQIIRIDESNPAKLWLGKLSFTTSVPVDTDRYTYEFSGWEYKATDSEDEYVKLTTEGVAVKGPMTVHADIKKTAVPFKVEIASIDESLGTVSWNADEPVEGSVIEVGYYSPIYVDGDLLCVDDMSGKSYYGVPTPAKMTMDNIYVFTGWDLQDSQVLGDITVTASFEALGNTLWYNGVLYQINSTDGGVTAIDFDPEVESIVIPDTFEMYNLTFTPTAVEEKAFIGCEIVDMVSIGSNVASIGFQAFAADCFKSIDVKADNESFASVKGVLYDKEVKTLLQFPLSKQRIVIPDTVTSIADGAFAGAGAILKAEQGPITYLRYISVPASVVSIGDGAFMGSTIECLKFEDGVVSIGEEAFAGCSALNYIVFPYTIAEAGPGAFDGCVFHDADGNVMEYDAADFKGYKFTSDSDSSELNLYVPETHSSIHKDGYIYRIVNAEDFLVKVYGFDSESIAEVSISETIMYLGFEYTVTGIMDKAFYSDKVITSVECFGDIGFKAFANCSNIKTLKVCDAAKIGDYAFAYCTSLVDADFDDALDNIGKSAFFGCTSLAEFDLSSVSFIGERAFARCPLTEADLASATDIGLGAFTGTALGKVVFGDALKNIDSRAFYGYTFFDESGNKLKVNVDNMAGAAFAGDGSELTKVLL